jgi:hypothetical protein
MEGIPWQKSAGDRVGEWHGFSFGIDVKTPTYPKGACRRSGGIRGGVLLWVRWLLLNVLPSEPSSE